MLFQRTVVLRKITVDKYGFLKFGNNMCSPKEYENVGSFFGKYVPCSFSLNVATDKNSDSPSIGVKMITWFSEGGDKKVKIVFDFLDGTQKLFTCDLGQEIDVLLERDQKFEEKTTTSFLEKVIRSILSYLHQICSDKNVCLESAVDKIRFLVENDDDKIISDQLKEKLIDEIVKMLQTNPEDNKDAFIRMVQCGKLIFH